MANLLALASMGRKRLTLSNASPANQLTSPTLNTPTSSTSGGSLGASTIFYYRLTAIDASGETIPGNEVNVTTGAGTTNQNTITWAAVTGATGYKLYRSTTQQTNEKLLATLGAVTTYSDTGSASPTVAYPTVNDTGLTVVATVGTGKQWRKLLVTANNRAASRNQFFVRVAGGEWVAYNADVIGYDTTQVAFDHSLEAGETIEAMVSSPLVRLTMSVEELA